MVAGEARGHEGLVHPVAGNGVDRSGGVADDERTVAGEEGLRPAHGQPVPADLGQLARLEAVLLAEHAQVLAQPRDPRSPSRRRRR